MSDICAQLHRALRVLERHRFPFDAKRIPLNGLYVLFEKGALLNFEWVKRHAG
jgi:hypothetical protein